MQGHMLIHASLHACHYALYIEIILSYLFCVRCTYWPSCHSWTCPTWECCTRKGQKWGCSRGRWEQGPDAGMKKISLVTFLMFVWHFLRLFLTKRARISGWISGCRYSSSHGPAKYIGVWLSGKYMMEQWRSVISRTTCRLTLHFSSSAVRVGSYYTSLLLQ